MLHESRDSFDPLSQAPLDALSFKMALLLALVSTKRACERTALSVSPSCLLLNEDSSFALLRPNPAFLPKNINSSFRSRDIVLKFFNPRLILVRRRRSCISCARSGRGLCT